MQTGGTQEAIQAGRDVDQDQSAAHPARAMMDTDDHAQSGRVPDLRLGQMDQQVADSPIQDLVQGHPGLGHGVHVQASADRDLPTKGDLGHPRRRARG